MGSPQRFVRPQVEHGHSMDFGVQVYAPAGPPPPPLVQQPSQQQQLSQEEQQQLHDEAPVIALPSSSSLLLEVKTVLLCCADDPRIDQLSAIKFVCLRSQGLEFHASFPKQPQLDQTGSWQQTQLAVGGACSRRGSAGVGQATCVHHVAHPLFSLQLQPAPLVVSVRAAAGAAATALASIQVRVEEGSGRLDVEVGVAQPSG